MKLLSIFMPILFILFLNKINAQNSYKNFNECIKIWIQPYKNYISKEYHYSEDYIYIINNDSIRGEYYSFRFEFIKQNIDLNKKELQEFFYYLIKRNEAILLNNENDMIIKYKCKECEYYIIISFYNYSEKSYIIEIINNEKR